MVNTEETGTYAASRGSSVVGSGGVRAETQEARTESSFRPDDTSSKPQGSESDRDPQDGGPGSGRYEHVRGPARCPTQSTGPPHQPPNTSTHAFLQRRVSL